MNAQQDTGFMSQIKNKFANAGLIPGAGQKPGAQGVAGMDMNKMMQMMMMQELSKSPGKNAGPEEWMAKLPMLLSSGMLGDKPKTIDPTSGKPSELPTELPPGMLDPTLEQDPSQGGMPGMPILPNRKPQPRMDLMNGAGNPGEDPVTAQIMRQLYDSQMIPNNFGY